MRAPLSEHPRVMQRAIPSTMLSYDLTVLTVWQRMGFLSYNQSRKEVLPWTLFLYRLATWVDPFGLYPSVYQKTEAFMDRGKS